MESGTVQNGICTVVLKKITDAGPEVGPKKMSSLQSPSRNTTRSSFCCRDSAKLPTSAAGHSGYVVVVRTKTYICKKTSANCNPFNSQPAPRFLNSSTEYRYTCTLAPRGSSTSFCDPNKFVFTFLGCTVIWWFGSSARGLLLEGRCT